MLLFYCKKRAKDDLPDPNSPLSSRVPSDESIGQPKIPPAYDPKGYPPPQQPGYPPQQPGYNPPPQPGYPPQGYPPQGYPPQGYPPQTGYAPAPAQQQSSTNVVVVGGAPAQQTTIIQRPKERVNHVLHLLITIFIFPPWVFVWIILCLIYGA